MVHTPAAPAAAVTPPAIMTAPVHTPAAPQKAATTPDIITETALTPAPEADNFTFFEKNHIFYKKRLAFSFSFMYTCGAPSAKPNARVAELVDALD